VARERFARAASWGNTQPLNLRDLRTPLLWLAAIRGALALIAIPLAPFLYEEHFLILVLLRPTKEVLLAGGYLAAKGDVSLMQIAFAAIPLAIVSVWHSFALGRVHHTEIKNGDLPWLANRVLKPDKVRRTQKVLRRRGSWLVFLGRLAAFPSTVIGLAAGASKMRTATFLTVDGIGGVLALSAVLALGYVAQGASSRAQWIATIGGVAMLLAFSGLLWWFMHQEPKGRPQRRSAGNRTGAPGKRRGASGRSTRARSGGTKRTTSTGKGTTTASRSGRKRATRPSARTRRTRSASRS
jgi:membrane protein DedA with SNARE-associated domain